MGKWFLVRRITHDFCYNDVTFNWNCYILYLHMNKFQEFETKTLVQMLGQHTQQLTSMLLKTVSSKEYEDCKKMIEELQSEIRSRSSVPDNTTTTRPDITSETNTTI